MKWCWARLPGGVVTWETYDLFKAAESGEFTDLFINLRITSY
jgi:hypothetical protein